MLVREAMTRNVPTIRVDKKLAAAQSIMEWASLNQLPVVDQQGHYIGLVTRESLRTAVPADETVPRAERARRLASTPVTNAVISDTPFVTTDSRLWQAAQLMSEHGVTCLPVIDGDRVAGLVTASNLVAALEEHHLPSPSREIARSMGVRSDAA
jgi:CBS domain-containing protein